ncbi:transposase [Streptomonospora salina]|uniref:Transposase n=1 Tax=Streptomonospora salina TaxID=104205 RepID=A0A841EKS4_9ACTN|nr:transposase [Streptomonospora salina]MBB6000011.1 transposase [Streptomonospora salina]
METEEESTPMAMKHYPAEFKADAVALYRSRPGATFAEIADELGVNRETLRSWIRKDDAERAPAPAQRRPAADASAGEPLEQENKRLRAQVAELWRRNARSCARRPPISRER